MGSSLLLEKGILSLREGFSFLIDAVFWKGAPFSVFLNAVWGEICRAVVSLENKVEITPLLKSAKLRKFQKTEVAGEVAPYATTTMIIYAILRVEIVDKSHIQIGAP